MFRRSGRYRKTGFYGRYNSNRGVSELKFLDRVIPAITISAPGDILNILPLLIPENTTPSGRIGRKLVVKSIAFRIHINLDSNNNAVHDIVRIICLIDKQCNGAQPALAEIFQTVNTATSFYNLQNSGRFEILFNRYYQLFAKSGAGNGSTNVFGEDEKLCMGYFKLNLPIEYNAATGAITEIKSNNIVMIAISTHGIAKIGADGVWRTRYYG